MDADLEGDIDELLKRLKDGPKLIERSIQLAVMREGHWLRGKMVKGVMSGAPGGKTLQPNSPWTIAMKKSSKPLIKSGAMVGSIAVHKLGGGGVFIGIKRTTKKGVNLARLHEKGAVIRQTVTHRQRRFFLAMTRKLFGRARAPKVGTQLVIRVPARPFLTPVIEKHHAELPPRIAKRFANSLLGGKYGTV